MKTLVVGIGNTILGDDGVGVYAAEQLQKCSLPTDVEVVELGTAGLGLLDIISGYDRLIILDAIVSGAPPGTIFELRGDDMSKTVHLSAGHEADLPATLALGRKCMEKCMPENITVIAVEASELTTFSEHLTPDVKAAIPEVLERVMELLALS